MKPHVPTTDDPVQLGAIKKEIKKGDIVWIKDLPQILATLDADGSLDGLPFMPEMAAFCGKRFEVARRAEKTCVDGHPEAFREFKNNDVVLLEALRCSGAHHDGCQRGCMYFWKEVWLATVNNEAFEQPFKAFSQEKATFGLKTTDDNGRFFCQSSELEKATQKLPRWKRVTKIYQEVKVGNKTWLDTSRQVAIGLKWKIRGIVLGRFPRGGLSKTPTKSLELEPGEWVEVKPYSEIILTLDKQGKNRGMQFDLDQRIFCGNRYRVKQRLDRMIREDTGQMILPKNTVILEGVNCQCIFATGGCPRAEAFYWREIWLNRMPSP